VSVGVGATATRQWLPPKGLYPRLRSAIRAVAPTGVRGVLWHQGESDAIAKTSAQQYAANMRKIITQSREDAGRALPWFVAIAAYHPHSSKEDENRVNEGQRAVIAEMANVFAGPNTDEHPKTKDYLCDSVHFNGKGLQRHAEEWAEILADFVARPPAAGSAATPKDQPLRLER